MELTMNATLAFIAIVLVFFGGVVVGHQYGLIHEKRREFNAIAKSIRDELTIHFDAALSQFPTLSPELEQLIFSVMSPIHRHAFHKNYSAYLDTVNSVRAAQLDNTSSITDSHLIEKHFRKVVAHLKDK